MRWLITDFKRGLTERSLISAVILGILSLAIGLGAYMYGRTIYVADEAFKASHSLVMPFIAPFLACMVYSNMNMLEKESGYETLLILKNQGKTYVLKRWLVNNSLSGIALVLPMFILYITCAIFSPYTQTEEIMQVILLDFCFGFVYGALAYSLTFFNKKCYIPVIAPQVIYLFFIYAFPYLNLEKFYPPLSFSPWLMQQHVEAKLISLELMILLGISGILVGVNRIYRKVERICLQPK